jgi:hypothetical protein
MSSSRTSAIALHVEAAKRLLRELEQHAETALHALGHDSSDVFVAAVDERDRILAQLDEVVGALASERAATVDASGEQDPEVTSLFTEMAQAAAKALASHDQLAWHTRRERDRLAAALQRTNRPDSIAHHYAVAATPARPRTLSVTG